MSKARAYFKPQTVRTFTILLLTYVVLCLLIIVIPYKIYDSDSSAYSSIAQKLARLPVIRWCAPEFGGHAGRTGLFQEHPPGAFWVTALFIRIGVPGHSAAFCANFLYIFFSLYFIYLLSSYFGGPFLGWSAVFAYTFTPIFLQYLIRANLEHPFNLTVIAGIYGVVRCEESWKYKVLFVLSLIFAFLVKGTGAFILIILSLLCWVIFLRSRRTLLFIIVSILITLCIMFLFEIWYRQVTDGTSFWRNYINQQSDQIVESGSNPLRKIYNFIWYMGRVIWFPAPWIFFIFYGVFRWRKEILHLLENKYFLLSMACATFIILWFSLFDRKADRYIFHAYCFLVFAGAWILLRLKPKITEWLQKKEKLLPFYLSSVLVIFTVLRIFFHTRFYRFIKFWPE